MQIGWLDSKAGQALLEAERQQARLVLERVFGDQIVQVGNWGPPGILLEYARTQATMVIAEETADAVDACALPERLAISTDSVDAVLLPHTLELSADPHSVLREVQRVLRPEGKLIVLGFNPLSWWGMRHLVSFSGYPQGVLRHISRRRLSDWLRLLNLRVDLAGACYVTPARTKAAQALRRTQLFANAYLIMATKESIPMTIVRPRIRRRPALVSTLANSSSRNVA